MAINNYPFFSVVGIEIEYMIVDNKTYQIQPISDRLIQDIHGSIVNECDLGDIALSNEFVLHVCELKTNGPKSPKEPIAKYFGEAVTKVNAQLEKFNATLLPGGMHPWYQPTPDVKLWTYDNHEIYETYDRIFQCSGHGFANIQSSHINLPFNGDEEFVKLHSACRVLLPIMPALAASSPFSEGKVSGHADTRLTFYAKNQQKIPMISGDIIPEFVNSIDDYHKTILQPMYDAIAHYDRESILQEEWLNSRGCIARFDRNALEIRVLDTQEAPRVDCALTSVISESLQYLIRETDIFIQKPIENHTLVALYQDTIQHDLQATRLEKSYCQQLAITEKYPITVRDCWHTLVERIASKLSQDEQQIIENLLSKGTLSSRLRRAYEKTKSLPMICERLSACLRTNEVFHE